MSKKTKRGVTTQPTNRPREGRTATEAIPGLVKTFRSGDRLSICGPNGYWFSIVGSQFPNELSIADGRACYTFSLEKHGRPFRLTIGGGELNITYRGQRSFRIVGLRPEFTFCGFTKAKRQAA